MLHKYRIGTGRPTPRWVSGTPPGQDDTESDASIVRRVRAGDVDAFGGLVIRYHGQCLQFAERVLGERADAEDAVQMTFVRAYSALGDWSAARADIDCRRDRRGGQRVDSSGAVDDHPHGACRAVDDADAGATPGARTSRPLAGARGHNCRRGQ